MYFVGWVGRSDCLRSVILSWRLSVRQRRLISRCVQTTTYHSDQKPGTNFPTNSRSIFCWFPLLLNVVFFGLDEASCPRPVPPPILSCIFRLSRTTGLALRCLTPTCCRRLLLMHMCFRSGGSANKLLWRHVLEETC